MKRISLTLFALALLMPAMAQRYRSSYGRPQPRATYQRTPTRWMNYDRESYFGLRLGVNVSNLFYSDDAHLDKSSQAGLNVGFVAGWQLTPGTPFFFETGLMYTEKGADVENNNASLRQKEVYNLNYIELPLVFKYKYFATRDVAIQPYFGGFLAMGVAGKSRVKDVNNVNNRVKKDSFSKDYFNRFDGGIRLGCGVSFQNLYFDMSYDFGLANVVSDKFAHDNYDSFDGKIRTGNFTATIGLDF